MTFRRKNLLAMIVVGLLLDAQTSFALPPSKSSGRHSHGVRTTNSWSGSKFRFPTEFLRTLINAPAEEQQKMLADKAERDRKMYEGFYRKSNLSDAEKREKVEQRVQDMQQFWLGKIKEYESLTPEQREQRIENTHRTVMLRENLKPLMKAQPLERAERLKSIPEPDRKLVEQRLAVWDKLPVDVQKQVLENDSALHYFARLDATPAEMRSDYLKRLPSSMRTRLEEDIERWNNIPERNRNAMQKAFASLFSLPESEQEKALTFLPEQERRKLEQALDQIEGLSADQRASCLQAYQKYLSMSPERREQFLANAEIWKSMSEEERAAWRAMVAKLPPQRAMPPIPSGLKAPPVAVPGAKQRR